MIVIAIQPGLKSTGCYTGTGLTVELFSLNPNTNINLCVRKQLYPEMEGGYVSENKSSA